MEIPVPEKRDVILYTRVTEENKVFLEQLSEEKRLSQSALVDHIINWYKNVGNKRKSK